MNNPSGAKRLSVSVAHLFLAKVLRAPLWLLISAMLARVLEPEGLGIWSMILAAGIFFNQILLQWTQSITQRFGPGEWNVNHRLDNTFAMRWSLLLGGFFIILLLLISTPFDWPKKFYGLDEQSYWFVLPAIVGLWLMAEVQNLQQVRERFKYLAWSPLLSDVVILVVIVALIFLSTIGIRLDQNFIFIILYLATICTWLVWMARELYSFDRNWRFPQYDSVMRGIIFAIPLIPGFLIGYLAEWADYFLIRHFYSMHEVGLFHPAYQYLLIMVGLPTVFASVLLPKIITANDKDGGLALRKLVLRQSPQLTVLWSMASLIAVAVLPTVFSLLLGKQYIVSVELLQILLIAVPGAIVQHIYSLACFVQGRLSISTLGFFGAKSLLNVALSFLLLPKLGVAGSAVGSVASYILLQWLFVFDQRRQLNTTWEGNDIKTLLVAQGAGLLLAMIDGLLFRLLIAFAIILAMLAWARKSMFFTNEEISAIIPDRLCFLELFLKRLLCRTAN